MMFPYPVNELYWDAYVRLCSQLFRESHLFTDVKTGSYTALCGATMGQMCHFLSKLLHFEA